jgi:D-glycero-alpha-D-manno-heptose-7-phosphate kinase
MMKIAARAPVRIDPAGGGTDAPPYSSEYGGCVVNMSVARYSYAQLQWLEPGAGAHVYSLDMKLGERATRVEQFEPGGNLRFIKGFVRRLLKETDQNDFLLVTQSDVPVRTGLGGSGALGVALTAACLKGTGRPIDQSAVALLANEIERGDLGLAGGSQDSFGAAVGGVKRIIYHEGGGTTCTRLNLPPGMAQRLERDMLLIYTGGIHLSATIHEDIKSSYAMENSPTIAAMDRLKAAANAMAGALEAGDMNGFVAALNDSRQGHYALHSSCDSDVLRSFFRALDPFILGGKTCGAGGGGFIVVVTRPGCKQPCIDAAEALGGEVWPFQMDDQGAVVWEESPWTADEVAKLRALATGQARP